MKKNLGVVPAVYPMPVLMVAAYDENEKHRRTQRKPEPQITSGFPIHG